MHYVIIGASAAGITAAETLRKIAPDSRITVISREKDIAYSRCLTTYYIAGKLSREDVFIRSAEQLHKLNLITKNAEVTGVDPLNLVVRTSDGDQISFDRLLISTGSSPVIPAITGLAGPDVYTLRTLADADAIISRLPRTKSAVILGDGLVAVSLAIALNENGVKVSLVGLAPHVLASFLDNASGSIIQNKLKDMGIELYMNITFKEVLRAPDGTVAEIVMSGGSTLKADLIVVAAGVKPELGFLAGTEIAVRRGILVNEYLETNLPGVFAAGDVIECYDFAREKLFWNPIWPNAVEQGMTAAYNMAGLKKVYKGCTNMNSANIGDFPITVVGLGNEVQGVEGYVCKTKTTYEKFVFKGQRLAGFILLGKNEKAGILTSLINQRECSATQIAKIIKGDCTYSSLVE